MYFRTLLQADLFIVSPGKKTELINVKETSLKFPQTLIIQQIIF